MDASYVDDQQQQKGPISADVLTPNANVTCPADVNTLAPVTVCMLLWSVPAVFIDPAGANVVIMRSYLDRSFLIALLSDRPTQIRSVNGNGYSPNASPRIGYRKC